MSKRTAIFLVLLGATRIAAGDPVVAPPAAEPTASPAPAPAPPASAAGAVALAPVAVSPWGSSPFVVAYEPPPQTPRTLPHHGLTFEVAAGAGSTTIESSVPAFTLAIGGWLSPELSLALRVSAAGRMQFVGGSGQLVLTRDLWLGAGLGQLSEQPMDGTDGERSDGFGGFGRVGYQIAGDRHVLYVAAELQAGSVAGERRAVGLLTFGYQLL